MIAAMHRDLTRLLSVGLLFAAGLSSQLVPSRARAHGGLPVSTQLLMRGDELLVPTPYWGIFLGRDGGDWRWICDEAINANQQRRVALSSDGQTLYATDRTGLTLSPDGGCDWIQVTGPLASLDVMAVVADPVQPARAYALANDAVSGAQTGLWKTEDRGKTWTLHLPLPTQLPGGLAVASDGSKVAVTTVSSTTPRTASLYEVDPQGAMQARVPTFDTEKQPLISVAPLAYEGANLYLRTNYDGGIALHRLDGMGAITATRLLKTTVPILMVLREPKGSLLVSTSEGIYQQQTDQTFKLLSTLAVTQCLAAKGSTVYACSWNYAPDLAAIARLSTDLSMYSKVFLYSETKGPLACPANTAVGKICPGIWSTYAEMLGVTLPKADMSADPTSFGGGSACSVGHLSGGAPVGATASGVLLGALLVARRRRRQRLAGAL